MNAPHSARPHGHAEAGGAAMYRDAAATVEPFGDGLTATVITCSDRAASGVYTDRSGPVAAERLRAWGFEVADANVLPDGDAVGVAIARAVAIGSALVVTAGGTGVAARDLTPEVTRPLLDRELPGIAEAIRAVGVARGIPTSVLSRGVVGMSGRCVIVNLPGSTGAVRDGLDVLATCLPHLLAEAGGPRGGAVG